MKKAYIKPYADKNQFNYRDQVVAASTSAQPDDSFMQNVAGIGSPVCGGGGVIDTLFDYLGSDMCN